MLSVIIIGLLRTSPLPTRVRQPVDSEVKVRHLRIPIHKNQK